MAHLTVADERIALAIGDSLSSLSALEIFRVAIRGASDVAGTPIEKAAADSVPGVVFHPQAADVALRLAREHGDVKATPVIRSRGEWHEVDLPHDVDHVLVGNDWYPLDRSTLDLVSSWARSRGDKRVDATAYLDLYRGDGPGFQVIDELSDAEVEALTGATTSTRVQGSLYPYQEVGLAWLTARAKDGFGGVLADEMGLGKTLQIIALIADRVSAAERPYLVVVPLTLVENWRREFAKFAPFIPVYVHRGSNRTRRPSELAKQKVVITTYETAVADEAILSLVDWDVVIADEAQAIKNPDALRTRVLATFRRGSAFAVTGTPLENRTQDTWSIASFAIPGYLGSRQEFTDNLESDPERLRMALRPLLLRREVLDVADDLPEKVVDNQALEMFSPEAAAYQTLIEGSRSDFGRVPVLALLTRLRMFTAHPDEARGLASPESRSAKLARLLEIVSEVADQSQKALVFVAFTRPADIVADAIRRRLSIPVWRLDGRTPVSDRQGTVDRFTDHDGPGVMVLNPSAGGVGLNIQAANHVVHYTLEWNPAREAQATARAWRRGQTLPVMVHRLYYVSSIDEAVLEMLEFKQDLFDRVIQPTDEEPLLKDLLRRTFAGSSLASGAQHAEEHRGD